MLWIAAAVASLLTAATPAPQQLVLRPGDVPAGFRIVPAASGKQPTGYRNTFDAGAAGMIASVAAVYRTARAAQRVVDVPVTQCGKPGTARLRVGKPLGSSAAFCRVRSKGQVAFVVAWRHGRVFAEVVLAGRPGSVTAARTLKLARRQEARIAGALAPALAA